MKQYKLLHFLCLLLGLGQLLTSCQQFEELEDLEEVAYEADFAVPLVDTRFTMEDLIESVEEASTIRIDEDGTIRLFYEGEVLTQSSEELFPPLDEAIPPVIPVVQPRLTIPLELPNETDIDRVDLKQGRLTYSFESRQPEPVSVTIRFPEFSRSGQPLTLEHELPAYSGNGPPPRVNIQDNPVDLGSYSIIPSNDSLTFEYVATTPDGDVVTLSNFLLGIQDLALSYAEGYLGTQRFEGGGDEIEIDFFEDWIQGDIFFADPQVTFAVANSIGIPTRSDVEQFEVVTVTGEVLELMSPLVETGLDFPFPEIDEVGQTKTTTFVFDKDNSNLEDILGASPISLNYQVDAISHPDQDTSIRGFITDSSFYRVDVAVNLPLFGQARNFVARDTFDFDLQEFEEVKDAEIKIVAENELPLDLEMQVFFVDGQGQVVDSLFNETEKLIAGAPVNDQGIATQVNRKVTFAPLPEEKFGPIRDLSVAMVLYIGFSTVNDGGIPAKVLAPQGVNIKMGSILGVDPE